jgi:hypothetical protein
MRQATRAGLICRVQARLGYGPCAMLCARYLFCILINSEGFGVRVDGCQGMFIAIPSNPRVESDS